MEIYASYNMRFADVTVVIVRRKCIMYGRKAEDGNNDNNGDRESGLLLPIIYIAI